MKTLSLLEMSDALVKAATSEVFALNEALHLVGKIIQYECKSYIGHLQASVGTFGEWEELADSTKDEKERLGYVFNSDFNPLLRTGELRDSIVYEVDMPKLEVIIGSKDPVFAYQEFGTKHIPPRPVIGRAAFARSDDIVNVIGQCVQRGIAGGKVIASEIGGALGYHRNIE